MSNQVEYGIRINVNGNRAASDAIDQVTEATAELGATAQRTGAAVEAVQSAQADSVAGHRAATDAIEQVTEATAELGQTTQRTSQAVQEAQQAQAGSAARLEAAQSDLNDTLRPHAAQLENVSGRHRAVQEAVRNTSGAVQQLGNTTAQTNAAMSNVPAQFTDIITSLQGGQNPLTVLLQQGGQLRDMFGSIGGAARGLATYVSGLITPWTAAAAVVAVLTMAWHQGAAEQQDYARTLIMTGNEIGLTTDRMADMAASISKSVGTQGAAAEAINTIASNGKVAADNLEYFTQVAVQMNRSVGKSVEETAGDLADLASAPLQASEKLNDQYHYLTASVYEHIKALQDQGREEEAGALAQTAYMQAFDKRSTDLVNSLGLVERGWIKVKDTAKGAWDAMLDIGREETPAKYLSRVQNVIALKQQGLTQRERNGEGDSALSQQLRDELALLRQEEAQLLANGRARAKTVEDANATKKQEEARIEWMREGDKYLARELKMKAEIAAAEVNGKEAGIDPKVIAERVAAIRKGYSDINNVTLAGLEARRNLERQALANSMADLESRHKQEMVSEVAYVTEKRDLQLKDLDAEAAMLKRQADLASANLVDRTRLFGQLAALAERRKGIIKEAQNSLDEYARAATKAIGEQSKAWLDATKTERTALSNEVELFGRSGEARKIATEQMKVEAELRQFVTNWQKQGHAFTAQEIADLEKSAATRRDNIAAIMGERQAVAGAEQLRQENQKFAAESLTNETARAAALLEIDANMWRERIALAGNGTQAQRMLQEEYNQWYRNQLLKPQLEAQKKVWESVESTAHDTFISIFDSGKSAFDRLEDSIKNGLLDLLYQMTVKKWIISISGQVTGQGGLGQAGGLFGSSGSNGSALGNAMSLVSIGKAIYSGFTGGIASTLGGYVSSAGSMFGSTAATSFGAGLSSPGTAAIMGELASGAAGASTGTAAAGSAAAGASAGTYAIPIAGWIAAGMALSNSLYKQGWNAENGSLTDSLGGKAIMPFNAPMLHLNKALQGLGMNNTMANMFSGASTVSALFGRKDPKVESQGLRGTISAAGFDGDTYANIVEKGGLFRSTKRYTTGAALGSEQDAGLDATVQGMIAAVRGFGSAMGIETSVITGYTKAIKLELGADETKNQEAIAKMFGEIGDELSVRLMPSIASLGKTGETASATLQRVATDYVAVDAALSSIGLQFGQVGIQSIAAREHLVDLFGGVDALTQQTAAYAQNFLTEAERLAPVQAYVTQQLAAMGLAGVTTREQFKAVVLGLDKTTDAGAKQFAAMMGLADAFALTAPAIDQTTASLRTAADIARERDDLQKQLDESTLSSAQLLARQRAALDDSNQALFDQVQAAKEAKQAQDEARRSLDDFLEQMRSFAESLQEFNSGLLLGDLSTLTPEEQYAEARRQFERTRNAAHDGDAAAQARLQDTEQTFLQISKRINGGDAQYSADFASVLNANEELAEWVAGSVDVAQASLTALNAQVDGITELNLTMRSMAQGVQNLPGTIVGTDVASFVPSYSGAAPGRMDAAEASAMLDELKQVRLTAQELVTEFRGLRADQHVQTGDQIENAADIAEHSTQEIVDGFDTAIATVVDVIKAKSIIE